MVGSGKKNCIEVRTRAGVCSWRGGNQPPPNQLEDSPVGSGAQRAAPAEIEFGVF